MNERIEKLRKQAWDYAMAVHDGHVVPAVDKPTWPVHEVYDDKFAELIVEECRNVVSDVYRKTPLELCGPLLTADEEIAKYFYGVEE